MCDRPLDKNFNYGFLQFNPFNSFPSRLCISNIGSFSAGRELKSLDLSKHFYICLRFEYKLRTNFSTIINRMLENTCKYVFLHVRVETRLPLTKSPCSYFFCKCAHLESFNSKFQKYNCLRGQRECHLKIIYRNVR